MYQALYRKWRPQTFDDVIGQQHITDSLKNQVSSGRLSHAYIFIGTRGTGKTTCARILAKAVNCEAPVNGNPCGRCAACRGISDGSIMDIVELDAASNNGVDSVRALRDEAGFSPADVRKRVYIIDEVHMLSTSAFNALLKIIEEPPNHLMFILATTELQKVPATILSRCQRHSFRRIDRKELSAYLSHVAAAEQIELTDAAADLIAGLAEGGVRDALSMLDQCSASGKIDTEQVYTAVGLAGNRRLLELLRDIRNHDTSAAVQLFNVLWRDGKDPVSLLKELSSLLRDILITSVSPEAAEALIYGGYDTKTLREFASDMSREELTAAIDSLQTAIGNISLRTDPKMTAELAIVSLCRDLAGDSVSALRARISALEKAISGGLSLQAPAGLASTPPTSAVLPSFTMPVAAPVAPAAFTAPVAAPPASAASPETARSASASGSVSESAAFTAPAADAEKNFSPASFVPESSDTDAEVWQKICGYVKELLPVGMRPWLNERGRITPRFQDGTLFVETEAGFFLNQMNRPEIISKFEAAVSAVTGTGMNVRVREHRCEAVTGSGEGDLEELRKFPEVRFV